MDGARKMKFKIVTTDPYGGSDYYQVFVVENDERVLASFGDEYHDKGLDKAQGYLEGYLDAKGLKCDYEHDEVIVGEDGDYCMDNDDFMVLYEKQIINGERPVEEEED
jgi:hypothetical protein